MAKDRATAARQDPAERAAAASASLQDGVPRPLLWTLPASALVDALVLGVRVVRWTRERNLHPQADLRVFYEAMAEGVASDGHQPRLGEISAPTPVVSAGAAPVPQIRIAERSALGLPGAEPGVGIPGAGGFEFGDRLGQGGGGGGADGQGGGSGQTRSPVVDLTNLAEAAQGNPVLLSYFSVIREQIQQTANKRTWMTGQERAEGIVYLSFVLSPKGHIQSAAVVPERSVSSSALQGVALNIIKSAGPFPPFPPSMDEPSKTVVVPLEFLMGS